MNKYKYKYYKEMHKDESTENILSIINNIDKNIEDIYDIYYKYIKFTDNEINLLIDNYKFKYKNDYHIEVNTDNYFEEMFIMKRDNYYILTKCVEYWLINKYGYNCGYKLDMYFKSFDRLCDYLDFQYLKD